MNHLVCGACGQVIEGAYHESHGKVYHPTERLCLYAALENNRKEKEVIANLRRQLIFARRRINELYAQLDKGET